LEENTDGSWSTFAGVSKPPGSTVLASLLVVKSPFDLPCLDINGKMMAKGALDS